MTADSIRIHSFDLLTEDGIPAGPPIEAVSTYSALGIARTEARAQLAGEYFDTPEAQARAEELLFHYDLIRACAATHSSECVCNHGRIPTALPEDALAYGDQAPESDAQTGDTPPVLVTDHTPGNGGVAEELAHRLASSQANNPMAGRDAVRTAAARVRAETLSRAVTVEEPPANAQVSPGGKPLLVVDGVTAEVYTMDDGTTVYRSLVMCERHSLTYYATLKSSGQLTEWRCQTKVKDQVCWGIEGAS